LPKEAGGVLPGLDVEKVYNKEEMMGSGSVKIKDMLDVIDWVVKVNAAKYWIELWWVGGVSGGSTQRQG
jgi:hypothetical protein